MNTDLTAKVDQLLEALEAITRGNKPDRYPPALFEQMKRMWEARLIIESPGSYVMKPGEAGVTFTVPAKDANGEIKRDAAGDIVTVERPIEVFKGDTRIQPIAHALTLRKENIDRACRNSGIRNYKVLGLDPMYRRLSTSEGVFDSTDPVEQCEEAAALILPRGDLHSLRQAVHVLKAKLDGDKRALGTLLVIQSTHNNFWEPVLNHLGLDTLSPADLERIGVRITAYPGAIHPTHTPQEAPNSTLFALDQLGDIAKAQPNFKYEMDDFEAGDILYACSGQAHKPYEIEEIFDDMKARVNVMPLAARIPVKPPEADEDAYTFAGNDYQKMESLHYRLHESFRQYGLNFVLRNLLPRHEQTDFESMPREQLAGLLKRVKFVADDRGFYFCDRRITRTAAYAEEQSLMNPYQDKPQPGAELAPVLRKLSKMEFFSDKLLAAKAEIESDPDKYGTEPVDLTAMDTACHIVTRLDWLLEAKGETIVVNGVERYVVPDLKYIATFGKTHSTVLTQPQPEHRTEQSDSFEAPEALNPPGTPPEKLRTKMEAEEAGERYNARHSEIALSLRALGKLMNIDRHANLPLSAAFGFNRSGLNDDTHKQDKPRYPLASQYSFFPEINGLGSKNVYRGVIRALNHSFRMRTGQSRRYDVGKNVNRVSQNQPFQRCDETHRAEVDAALYKMRLLFKESHGFLLLPDDPRMSKLPGYKWLKLLLFTSLVVGKQVGDIDIVNKFVGVCDWGDEKSWKPYLKLFYHQNDTPLLGDRLHTIMATPEDTGKLGIQLQRYKNKYVPPSVLDDTKARPVKEDNIPIPHDLYRVTIYCSASLISDHIASKEAQRFTRGLAASGYSVINGGGGLDATMKCTSEGVHEFRDWWVRNYPVADMPRNHIASFQCDDTFERENGWHPRNDFALVLKTIETRMSHLQNTDAEIMLAGGQGSIQEIAGSLLMRAWGITPTKHRPLVIVDQQMTRMKRAFTPLLALFTPEELKALNVHFVKTTDEAMKIVMESRDAMKQEPGMENLYIPALGNDNTPIAAPLPSRYAAGPVQAVA